MVDLHKLLERVGLDELRDMILALTFGVTGVLALVGLWSLRRSAPPPARDAAQKLWVRLQTRLRASGFKQGPAEGPQDFAQRAIAARPQWETPMRVALDAYLRMRYFGEPDTQLERLLAEAAKQLPVKRLR